MSARHGATPRPRLSATAQHALFAYALVLPSVLLLLGLIGYPFLYAIFISFTNRVVGNPGHWVGLANFRYLVNSPEFQAAVWNTITIVIASEDDKDELNYEPLKENLAILRKMGTLRIEKLPMPEPVVFDGQRLPASYANFYIANNLVLVPTFNDPKDRIALNKLAQLFPDRKIVGIASMDLVLGLGTLHCMTQQEPA